MPSIPKVRASSGTIGTTYLPSFLSRVRIVRILTNAIVVDISRSPEPFSKGSRISILGIESGAAVVLRTGRCPPNSLRREFIYCNSSLSAGICSARIFITNWDVETVLEVDHLFFVKFLLAVSTVLALSCGSHSITFNGVR